MTLLDDMKALQAAVDIYKAASAALSCNSSSCPHSRCKGGQMVNGPCRCYPHAHPMRQYVLASALLHAAAVNLLPTPQPVQPTRIRLVKK